MSAKGLLGKTSFIPEYITIHRFSLLPLFVYFNGHSLQTFRARIRLSRFARGQP